MRCPKCGYTSFDHLDSCKKCGKDLAEFKARYGIKSVLFPGQTAPGTVAAEAAYDDDTADAAVAAATGAVGVAATVPDTGSNVSESDDFGFDFMGDSAEDDDLSFDELFEEAPEDEDVEETIEGPKQQTDAEAGAAEEFSFDLPEEDTELEDDFGFDPTTDSDEDFAFDDEEEDLSSDSEDQGSGEDPKSPFDLPESSVVERAPVDQEDVLPEVDVSEDPLAKAESGDLFALSAQETEPLVEPENYFFEPVASEENTSDTHSMGGSEDRYEQLSEPALPPLEEPAEESGPVSSSSIDEMSAANELPLRAISETPVAVANPPIVARIGAFLCDLVLLSIVGISFIVVAEAAMSTEGTHLFPSLETLIDLSVPYFLVLFSLAFGYFTLFHFLAGQTPGKMLVGLRVETTEGEPLAFAHAFLRSVGGLLQLLPVGLGYLFILTSTERRGWNDRLAGTRVVYLKGLVEEA